MGWLVCVAEKSEVENRVKGGGIKSEGPLQDYSHPTTSYIERADAASQDSGKATRIANLPGMLEKAQ